MTKRTRPPGSLLVTRRISRRAALPRLGAAAAVAVATARAGLAGAQPATPIVVASAAGHVVIRRYHLKPGATYAELTRLVETGLIPSIRELPGFVEYTLVEPGNGEHIVISTFTDEATATASAVLARDWAAATVADLVEIPAYDVISGPVGLEVRAAPAATPAA